MFIPIFFLSVFVFFDRMLYLHFKFVFCCCQIFALCFCVVTLLSCCIYFQPISVQISRANRARLDRSDDVTGESSVCGTLPSAKIRIQSPEYTIQQSEKTCSKYFITRLFLFPCRLENPFNFINPGFFLPAP